LAVKSWFNNFALFGINVVVITINPIQSNPIFIVKTELTERN